MMKLPSLTGLRTELNAFLGAVMFLTQIPVGAWHEHRAEDLPRSSVYFPLIGALVGLAGSAALLAINPFLPPLLTVLVVMALMVLLTGGLHEDGLADAADGLIGGSTVERRLEIMQDSRIGSYGVLALWFSLTAKFVLIDELLILNPNPFLAFCALIAANTLGRTATVALLYFCRYVRPGESKAGPFGNVVSRKQFVLAAVSALVMVGGILGFRALLCLPTAILVTFGLWFYFQRKLGGITGDCLGASNQLVELSCYAVLLFSLHPGAG